MLKGINKKNQVNLDQQRLETDIAQLINENKSLKIQVAHLNSEIDFLHRDYQKKHDRLDEVIAKVEAKLELANTQANDIMNTAYTNADMIIKEVLSSAYDAMDSMSKVAKEDLKMNLQMEFKLRHLEHILSGVSDETVKNLILFNKDHDTFFKK